MMKNSLSKYSYRPSYITMWLLVIAISVLPLAITKTFIPSFLIPQIEYIFVFFGSLYFGINPLGIFLYGLFIDSIYGYSIGTSSLLFLLISHIIDKFKFKLINLEPKYIILYFALTIFLVSIFQNLIFSIQYSSRIIPYYYEILGNILVNIVFYTLFHIFLYKKIQNKSYEN